MRPSLVALALVSLSAALAAQSMNVDICKLGVYDPPSAAYGGAAGQPGTWSTVLFADSHTLIDVHDNNVETATAVASGVSTGLRFDDPTTSGDDQLLLDDGASFGPQGTSIGWDFGPLFEGEYVVYTYAWNPAAPANQTQVVVIGALEGAQTVGGAWTGTHVQGVTYARHTLSVAAQGYAHVDCTALGAQSCVVGFQFVRQEPGIPFCFGDGSVVPCPCGNNSSPGFGRGCATSNAGSMNLFVCGHTTPSDSIVLVSHSQFYHPHGGLRVYMQGTASIAPVAFGDGLRCVGGTLKRLYARTDTHGLGQTVPGPGDLSVSAQSAALGDPLAPGSTRCYTTYFRDGSPTFCPAPAGSTFNVTNAYQLTW